MKGEASGVSASGDLEGRRKAGRRVRERVHGDDFVVRTAKDQSRFLQMYYDATEEFCWGTIWASEALALKERAMLALALTASKGQIPAVEQHVRTCRRAGWSPAEIGEILLHVYCYAGCYASLGAFVAADAIFRREGGEIPEEDAPHHPDIALSQEAREWAERLGAGPLEAQGMQVRRELFGEEDVRDWMADTSDDKFMMMFFRTAHAYCFGTVWARPGLGRRQRSMLSLAITAAQNQHGAVRRHVRGCALAGLTRREIGEVLLQVFAYAGMHATQDAFRVASDTFRELAEEGFAIADGELE